MNGINPIWLVVLSIGLALFPILIGMGTSYIKVSIVLGMLKSALGAQNTPGSIVIMAMSLALTVFVMSPVFEQTAVQLQAADIGEVVKDGDLKKISALSPVLEPWKSFISKHAGERERKVLRQLELEMSPKTDAPKEVAQTNTNDSFRILIPAFVLTELRQAFTMGFMLLLPFVVVDLIVANILAGLGMFMVSPVMISLPLKLLLFVASDGWIVLTRALIGSYV
jgi:type III secretory pathway component EscR